MEYILLSIPDNVHITKQEGARKSITVGTSRIKEYDGRCINVKEICIKPCRLVRELDQTGIQATKDRIRRITGERISTHLFQAHPHLITYHDYLPLHQLSNCSTGSIHNINSLWQMTYVQNNSVSKTFSAISDKHPGL